jgi:hypothetical protein
LNDFGGNLATNLGELLERSCPAEGAQKLVAEEVGFFRERIYPPLTTLGLFIGQALSQDGACQDAVSRRLSERTARGEPACSLSSGPYCKARQRLPLGLIRKLAFKSTGTAKPRHLEMARSFHQVAGRHDDFGL